jgi:hypothetical protein
MPIKNAKQQQEKEAREQTRLLQAWLTWHREERKAVLAGPHAHMVERLFYILKDLKPSSQPLLFGFVRAVPWADIDDHTRRVILREIGDAIVKLRVKSGLEPFDDPLLDDRPNVFGIVKEILFPERAPVGAEPGIEIQQHNISGIGT